MFFFSLPALYKTQRMRCGKCLKFCKFSTNPICIKIVCINKLAHQVLVLVAYVQMPLIIADAVNFGLSLHLHTYFMYANSQGSGKSGHML